MIRAILEGRKTVTRRIGDRYKDWKKGDLIWVKETFYHIGETGEVFYRATGDSNLGKELSWPGPWKPSIFMRRAFSRIILEMTADAREEPLQDITEEDCDHEGTQFYEEDGSDLIGNFKNVWYSIYGDKAPWSSNPIVHPLEFRKVKP